MYLPGLLLHNNLFYYVYFPSDVMSEVRKGRAFQDTFVHNELYVLSLNIWIVFASITNVSCTTGVTCGTGTAHPSGAPEFTVIF
jgi:hypothetical protein